MNVWDCALGFMNAQILLTAEELGVFARLSAEPHSSSEMAAATGLPPDSAARLLTALASMELVQRRADGRYANAPEAAEKLVPGTPGYVGAMFAYLKRDLYPLWSHFGDALREGTSQWHRLSGDSPPRNEQLYSDPQALRAFLTGMHAVTYGAAAEFASCARELDDFRSVVDVGGASGAFVIALAERNTRLHGSVVDLPPVRDVAEEFVRKHGLSERLRFVAADFWKCDLPEGADAYSLGFILHDWDTEAGSLLLEKIARASPAGGRLIIGEYLLDEERTGPPWVARSDLNMLVAARGRERTAGEYASWIRRFGFALERIYLTSTGKSFLIASRA